MTQDKSYDLKELLSNPINDEYGAIKISGLASDSRKVKNGDLFFALQGVLKNGADFAKAAQIAGAAAIVSEVNVDGVSIPQIIVKDARDALSHAAAIFYPAQPETIIAITGTNGKSSTVDFLRQIWAACGHRAASLGTLGAITPEGSVNLGFTTPDPISLHANLEDLAQRNITHVAMESSSHALVQKRMHGVKLKAGGFSNLTQDHLDYHETMDSYAEAKMLLFTDLLPKSSPAVVNADAEYAPKYEEAAINSGLDLKLVGWRGNYLKIQELWPKPASQRVDYRFENKTYPVEIPLIGEFQALNATMAAGLALSLGEKPENVFKALTELRPVKGRMEHIGQTKEGAHIFVDYAHTPDGLDVLLRAVRPHAPGKIILVFGCGGDRDKTKRPKMGAIGAKHADIIIVTDDNPRTEDAQIIRREIMVAVPQAQEIADRKTAIETAIKMAGAGDAVIIAGKGHETGQIVMDKILPFSDQETAIDYLNANGGQIV
ncbi:MAG: UDP-N-acetylmuramoyl-L-alanyl-D-glutamate--2,6-diaminopimelate ligase [Caulobacterales bacterium]|nr:UDP-N-acetylmuramoyl-L-alanyl-D-glutamate--2,6-diaminopimelate ligase [Caulobacterales bacterium]MCA0371238.1 UDP-N-acetylmuramoyl-L-alanyl-D-glutamate--2,6-diaminopimelate ligase [Pseudomonadota bacterium]